MALRTLPRRSFRLPPPSLLSACARVSIYTICVGTVLLLAFVRLFPAFKHAFLRHRCTNNAPFAGITCCRSLDAGTKKLPCLSYSMLHGDSSGVLRCDCWHLLLRLTMAHQKLDGMSR